MIASVAFRNFKALRAASLRLGTFNLVIGANGSGKTTLIQAVLQLRALARLPVAGDKRVEGEADAPEITFRFSPPFEGMEAWLGCSAELRCDLLRVNSPSSESWTALKAALGRMRSFVFDHTTMAAPAARSSGAALAADGANLAAVVAWRREHAPVDFARLEAEVRRILPEFSALVTTTPSEGSVGLELALADGSGHVPLANLSQGTLYLLNVLALAFDPAPPTVVCIEEIDRGIHPRMLREMRDALYRLSYPSSAGEKRPAVQVIATTQSPYFLDLFREHPEEIVITQKRGNAAHFEHLSDRPDLPDLLQEGSLGDIWFSGILGGVPEERLKVALLSESPADEAVLRALVGAVLGTRTEFVHAGLRARGWPNVVQLLPAVIRHLHFNTDVQTLVVTCDSDDSVVHVPAHDAPNYFHPQCRMCQLRGVFRRTVKKLPPARGRTRVLRAVGVAVPALEAWLLCGRDSAVGEAAWVAAQESGKTPYSRRELKWRVYGTDRPTLPHEIDCALKEVARYLPDTRRLEYDFPGFEALARDLRENRDKING